MSHETFKLFVTTERCSGGNRPKAPGAGMDGLSASPARKRATPSHISLFQDDVLHAPMCGVLYATARPCRLVTFMHAPMDMAKCGSSPGTQMSSQINS
eukprot:355041-Chlamydomonas_euryale.AAC.9